VFPVRHEQGYYIPEDCILIYLIQSDTNDKGHTESKHRVCINICDKEKRKYQTDLQLHGYKAKVK
jgi:hypothetical protein